MLAHLLATADPQLQDALDTVTTYFTANIGIIITAVVGIAVFMWLLRIGFRSFGVRKPKSVE